MKVESRSPPPAAPARPGCCPHGTRPSSNSSPATFPAAGVACAPDGRRAQHLPRRRRQRVSRVMDAVPRHVPAVGRHTSATRAPHSPPIQECVPRVAEVSRPSVGTWRATPARGDANVNRRPAGEGQAARGRRAHLQATQKWPPGSAPYRLGGDMAPGGDPRRSRCRRSRERERARVGFNLWSRK